MMMGVQHFHGYRGFYIRIVPSRLLGYYVALHYIISNTCNTSELSSRYQVVMDILYVAYNACVGSYKTGALL